MSNNRLADKKLGMVSACGHNTCVVTESQLNSILNPTLQNKFYNKFNEKSHTAS